MAYAGSVVATLNGPGEEVAMPINAWDTAWNSRRRLAFHRECRATRMPSWW